MHVHQLALSSKHKSGERYASQCAQKTQDYHTREKHTPIFFVETVPVMQSQEIPTQM